MLNLNENLQSIASYAFYNCDGLLSLVLNDKLETLSANAFADCSNLTAVTVPKTVTSFDKDSFSNCAKLTIYCYSGSAAHLALENTSCKYFLLDAHEHEFAVNIETSATCLKEGSQIKTCTICGYNFIELVDPLGHLYEKEDVAPTCTEDGYTLHTCSRCNDSYKDNWVDALGHSYGEWSVTKEATCTLEGKKVRVCERCNHNDEATIPAKGHSFESTVVEPDCTHQGYTIKNCSVCHKKEQTNYTSALGHSYGSWITDNVATVLAEGKKHRDCIRCDHQEISTTPKITIDVDKNREYGLAEFTIVDATNKQPIPNACLYISTENDGEATLIADSNGKLSQVLPVGQLSVSAYSEGYLSRNLKINVNPGRQVIPTIGISVKPLVDGELTVTEMTYDEIVAAGIDVNAPGNNHVYKYEAKITFKAEIDALSIITYFNDFGINLGSYGYSKEEEQETGSGGGGGSSYAEPVYYHWENPYPGIGKGNGMGFRISDDDAGEITVFPVSERFYLIIYGEVRWLKEMYDVELLAINNSMTDTIENCEASLTLPDGLSLAEMVDGEQSLVQTIGHIDEGGSKSVHWYVRGDKEGTYNLTANLSGTLMPFEEDFDYEFEAKDPLKVYAGTAMHMTFIFPDSAFYNDDYTIRIELENVSNKTLYGVKHKINGFKQCKVTTYSDGHTEETVYKDQKDLGQIGVDEFKPGDKLVIELTTNIMFQSELIQAEIDKWKGLVDGIEKLMNGYKAFTTAVNGMTSMYSFISGASKNIDKIATLSSHSELEGNYADLLKSVRKLQQKFSKGDAEALKVMNKLEGSKAYEFIKTCGDASEDEVFQYLRTIGNETIIGITADIDLILRQADNDKSEKYTAYDAYKTALDLIPVRFKLAGFTMTTLEGSTTEIPTTYKTERVGARYFGVDNVADLLVDLGIIAGGRVDAPFGLGLLGLDDPTGYDNAIKDVKAIKDNASKFLAKDATGDTTFRAWVEKAPTRKTKSNTKGTRSVPDLVDYTLTTDNETATFENGVLSFTGMGYINVTPNTMEAGVLHVEDSEGHEYLFNIEVVDEHDCEAGEWESVLYPTDGLDGFRVKRCVTCGKILDFEIIKPCKIHSEGEFVTEIEPTCEAIGRKTKVCSVCGKHEYEIIPKLPHTVNRWTVTKEATCSEEGTKEGTCSVCGNTVIETIEKTHHTPGEWVVTKEATPFENGEKELHCKDCDAVMRTSSIPKTTEKFGLDSDEKIISGFGEQVTPEMLIDHYADMGITVTVTDADGDIPDFIGTNCKLYCDGEEYTIVVKGDTNGDGEIDIFDYFTVLDYLNDDCELDEYQQMAALFSEDEDEVSIFDAFALIDYINGDRKFD